MSDWQCTNCTVKNSSENFLCNTCKCAKATATRKIRPPVHSRGKFMDKVVSDLVQKATKRKPPTSKSEKSDERERVKRAIRKKVDNVTPSQKRRESLMEKQFKAKADQIAKLAQELESMKESMMERNGMNFGGIEDQLKTIGELMVSSSIFSSPPPSQSVPKSKKSKSSKDFDPNCPNGTSTGSRTRRKPSVFYDEDVTTDEEWEPEPPSKTTTTTNSTKKPGSRGGGQRKQTQTFVCDQCDFACSSDWYLNKHKVTHINATPFKCEYGTCEFEGTSKYFLLQHIAGVHVGVPKPFPCDKCECDFHDKASFNRHQKTHDDKKAVNKKTVPKKTVVTKKTVTKKTVTKKKKTARKNIANSNKKKVTTNTDADDLAREVEVIESYIDEEEDDEEEDVDIDDKDDDDWEPGEGATAELVADEDDDDEEEDDGTVENDTSNGSKTKEPKEKKSCPHEGCDFQSSALCHMTRHRKRVHNEEVPKKKRDQSYKNKIGRPRTGRNREKKYSCNICGVTATSMWYIHRHMRSHTGEKPFGCEFENCNYRAFRKFHLTRHILNMHSDERPHKCSECDYHAKTRDGIRQHYITKHTTERNEKCLHCDYATKSKEALRSHSKKIHRHVCKSCVWEFISEERQIEHMNRHQEDGKIYCHLCSHLANDLKDLKEHCMLVHDHIIETRISRKPSRWLPVCEICQYQFPSELVLQNHKAQHTAHGLVCSVCNILFGDMELLKDHCLNAHGFGIDAQKKRQRHANTIFTCTICSYEFPSEYGLKIHTERHRPDGSIACGQCSHISTKMSEHVEHSKSMHDIDVDAEYRRKRNFYCCEICKYLFSSQQRLEIHKLQHLSDGSIQCAHCPAIMSKMKNLDDHMVLMHSIKIEATLQRIRPYLFCCPVCSYMFENKEQLNAHRERHLPDGSIACDICPYTAPEMEFLKIHMIEVHSTVLNTDKKRHKRRKGDPPREPKRAKRPYNKSGATRNQLSQIPNHNITDILYGANNNDVTINHEYDTPVMGRQYTNSEIGSYISPPSCAFDGSTPNSLNFDTRVQNPFATLASTHNIFNNLSGSPHTSKEAAAVNSFINQTSNNTPVLTINNSHSISNNFSFNQRTININNPIICGSNRVEVNNNTPLSIPRSSAPLSIDLSSLIPGGLPQAIQAPIQVPIQTPIQNQNNGQPPVIKKSKDKFPKKLPVKGQKGGMPQKSTDPSPRLKAFPGLFM